MLNARFAATVSLVLLSMFGTTSVSAGPGLIAGPPEAVNDARYIECDRTTCDFVTLAQLRVNSPTALAPTDPDVVGPPAGQRYIWRAPASCDLVPFAATPGNPFAYIVSKPIPVPLGSTHATLSATAEALLAGAGTAGVSTMFGRLQIRRSADGVNPAGTWVNSDRGYVYSRTGSEAPSIRYGKATFMTLEDLTSLPGGSGIPVMIEIRLAVNAYSDGNWVYSIDPQICKGSMQLAF